MHKVNTIPADALPPGHQKLWYHPIETFPVCMMVIFWEYSGNSGKCCENVSSPRADTGTIGKTLVRIILWCPTTTRTTRTPAFWGYPRRLMITHTIESCGIPSQNMIEWPWRYRSRSKVITCDTPSHASDHLYQIWKESIQNCRR